MYNPIGFYLCILQRSSDNLVHAFGEVANVLRVQSSHGNPAVRRQVDVSFVDQRLTLLSVETGEPVPREGTNESSN